MKIAIFGGAFDPFHSEHKKIILACKSVLGVDKVVVVPSQLPPHKSSLMTDFDSRCDMIKLATSDIDYVQIDDIEKNNKGTNPTYKTLPLLSKKYPCDELYFIIGGDSMVNFHSWIKPEVVAKYATIAVVKRDGYDNLEQSIYSARKDYNAKIVLMDVTGDDISSSIIKATIELGLETQNLQKEVLNYIIANQLYSHFSSIVNKLKEEIPTKTFNHVSSTVIYAMRFVAKLNLNYEKVFLACILHDCAKHKKIVLDNVPAPVVHQFTGADCAKSEYHIDDEEVLDAIRYHTSGKPDMSNLGKLVYVADMLEPLRHYDKVDDLREEIEKDFDTGFYKCIKSSMEKLIEEKNPIYPLTKSCLEYYTSK
jgi:nicotinate-nucleotide adenylyltransferase